MDARRLPVAALTAEEEAEAEAEEEDELVNPGLLYWLRDGTLVINDAHKLHGSVASRVRMLLLDRRPEAPRVILTSERALPWLAGTDTVEIKIPPLRLRPADIADYKKYFLGQLSSGRDDGARLELTEAASRRLLAYG